MIVQTGEPQLRKPLSDIFPEFNGGPSSRGSTYWRRELQCAREGLLSNDLGWTPVQLSEALDMGLLWHLMLERFYKVRMVAQREMAGPVGTALRAAVNPMFAHSIDPTAYFSAGAEDATRAAFSVPDVLEGHPDYDNDTWRGRLERMLKSYLVFSRGDQWEILAVEQEFRTDAANPRQGVTYTSRLDLVVRDYEVRAAPVLRSVEHKSSTFDDPQTLKMFTHDLQTWGQVWVMANALEEHWPGEQYAGGLVNLTTKGGKVEWSKAQPRNHRVVVAPPWEGLLEWRESMLLAQQDQLRNPERGWPKNWAACNRPYGLCPYFDVCSTDVSRGMLEQGRPYTGHDYAAGAPVGPFFERQKKLQLSVLP